jgi:hypothetical protein
MRFLKKYHQVNGSYPDLHGKKYVKKNINNNPIYVHDEVYYLLHKRCLVNGIGLIGITHFDFTYLNSFFGQKDVFNLSISAIDLLDDSETNGTETIEQLNYLLDF